VPHELTAIEKQRIALRYWLLGARYFDAAAAMEWAAGFHRGTRKDGHTPEFSHQIAIASHVRAYGANLRFPEESITVAFLHDVREDYDVSDGEVRERFGDQVADDVDAMTKVFRGVRRDDAEVFATIATRPNASVVKLCDRIHNHSSMVGVFTPEKITSYVAETSEYFLPMLKIARRNFCDQEPVYEALSLVLHTQIDLLHALVGATSPF
jgi:(p)ppGpp synthase/HD superfamily hydrolase